MRTKRETRRLRYEPLEDRRMLSVYTVSSTADSGPGSLRDAIAQANANLGADEIAFAPELSGKTIELSSSQLTVSDTLFIDATSLPGGVTIDGDLSTRLMYINSGATVELRGLTFTGGNAISAEGALVNFGTLIIDSCTFIENVDDPIWNAGRVTISRSFFHHNTGIKAAGLYNQGIATIVDSTFAENGRGTTFKLPVIATVGNSGNSLTIERSTIGGDENAYDADGQGMSIFDRAFFGPINPFTPRVVINNSVVFGNVNAPAQASYSLLGDVNPALVAGVGNVLNADPQLGPLADNGGPTPTYAVLPSSPALNSGDPSFVAATDQTDQRGGPYQRLVGRLDMGAYEAQATPVGVPGDFNADGRVDAADYVFWRRSAGTTVSPLAAGDATGDGLVDDADYRTWRGHFGFVPLGGKLVVNDLGDRDDGDIYNGRLTLREAINYQKTVTWADSITFDPSLSGGVIQVGTQGVGYYQIEKKLTIDARMLPEGITIDAGGRTIGMHINAFTVSTPNDFDVTLAGLTIIGGVGGVGGGGAINSLTTGKLTVIDCQLLDSSSSGVSGAIYARGDLEIVDSLIDGAVALGAPTTSSGIGTAIFADGDVTLFGSTIRNVGDATHRNNGILVGNMLDPGTWHTATLIDSEITDTTGGGVTVQGHVHMEGSRIENTQGPGIFAPMIGSGLTYVAGSVTLIDSTVSNNTSTFGAAFLGRRAGNGIVAGGNVVLNRSRVENNRVVNYQDVQGGGITANGHVMATDSLINGNDAEFGGGIYARGVDAQGAPAPGELVVTLDGTAVNNNQSQRGGAAIHSLGSVAIDTSSLSGNNLLRTFPTGDTNGVVFLEVFTAGHTLNIADSVLAGNSGLLDSRTRVTNSLASASIEIARSQVIDNEMNGVLATRVVDSTIARNAGTGVSGSTIEILGSTVSGNRSGGIQGSTLHIRDSTIRGNVAFGGGAGAFATGSIFVERSLIADNHTSYTIGSFSSQASGGLSAGTVVLVDSTVQGNSVRGPGARGGGINSRVAEVYGSTISGNAAIGEGARGGGIFASSFSRLRQLTVSGNHAEGTGAQGGGVWAPTIDALQVTIVGNQATGDLAEGGGIYTESANRLVGGVLADNSATSSAPDLRAMSVDPSDTLPGVSYSLVRDPEGSPLSTGGGGIGNLLGADPLLGPLADNGGPTETHAPLPGSPLIDAGDPTLAAVPFSFGTPFPPPIIIAGTFDQRGEPYERVVDGGSGTTRIDIGAVEVQTPGNGSQTVNAIPLAAPLRRVTTRTSDAVASDAALAAMADDDLLLLIAAELLVADESDMVDRASRKTLNNGLINEDPFAVATLVGSLPTL